MSDKIDERYNTFIHFIYGPAKTTEANTFWTETEKNISKKKSNKNEHFIIGDLNVQLEKQDSNSEEKIKLPKAFKKILKTHLLVDAYKIKNKKERTFTYIQLQNDIEVKFKLDYTLTPIDVDHVVIHPCPSTSRIETRTAMRIAAHGLCVCRCILYYSFHSTTAYWCHPFHPLYYSDRLWAHVSLVS